MANRPKMDRERRAKQFMPFDALKGYHEALKKKEEEVYQYHTEEIVMHINVNDDDKVE